MLPSLDHFFATAVKSLCSADLNESCSIIFPDGKPINTLIMECSWSFSRLIRDAKASWVDLWEAPSVDLVGTFSYSASFSSSSNCSP